MKKVVVRPEAEPPEAGDAAAGAARLTVLVHELANLLDGSLRCLSLARTRGGGTQVASDDPGELGRRLDTVQRALERMSDLVHEAAGRGKERLPGAARKRGAASVATLAEAVAHAADVMRPVAEDANVRLEVEVSDELAAVPAFSMYRVVADAVRNSVESISVAAQRSGSEDSEDSEPGAAGVVRVQGRMEARGGTRMAVIEVTDDGIGPPPSASSPDRAGRRLFDFGYTTKPGGSGIGLAAAREAVEGLGGAISLRAGTFQPGTARRGAVLRVEFPAAQGDRRAEGGA